MIERMKDLLSFVIAAMAMVSLVCAVYQGMNDRIASAGVLAGVFFLATALFYLPQLDTLSAYGVQVRLRNTLDRADEIIGRLKKLAEANAKATYMNVTWGNRLGSPPATDKQKVLDDIDAQLIALGVDASVRQEIAKPLIAMIGVDLYSTYSLVMDRLVFWLNQKEEQRFSTDQAPDRIARHQAFVDAVAEWRKANAGKGPRSGNYDLDEFLARDIPTSLLSDPQKAAAQSFRGQVLKLYNDSVKKGGYTPETATFLDEGGDDWTGAADKRVREIFAVDTSAH